jgi:hypothetical protein
MTRKTYPNLKEGTEIAKLLGTSSEYLITGTEPEGLNALERKLINTYRKLNLEDRENIILAMNAWVSKNE